MGDSPPGVFKSFFELLGNLIWLLGGGVILALEYLVAATLLTLTVIGIPFALPIFKLALLALWPFGKRIVHTAKTVGCFGLLMNVLWLVVGGWVIVLTHLFCGMFFCLTGVGIPWGWQHFKLAAVALTPFGVTWK